MIQACETGLPGSFELSFRTFADERGSFVKTFHRDCFASLGLRSDFAEEYYTVSRPGVLRGLHFQTPPHEHAKLVYCIAGRVLDAGVDLRRGSPTYGKYFLLELSAKKANAVYLPPGLAHGFFVPEGEAVLVYKVTSAYAPAHDAGIRWDSAGIPWPAEHPILSSRDSSFPAVQDFDTPFQFEG